MINNEKITNDFLHSIDWKQYINDYSINKKYGSDGIKIQSKTKDINEIDIEDLYHLDDPDYQYCMFDFDLDLRYANHMISCLLNGKSFSYYYDKNDKNREICFEFDLNTYTLTRHFKNNSGLVVTDNKTNYYLNKVYVAAIINFLLQRRSEKIQRDSNNNKVNIKVDKAVNQEHETVDINKSFEDIIVPFFNSVLNEKIMANKLLNENITPNSYGQIVYDLYKDDFIKNGMLKDLMEKNKINYDINEITKMLYKYTLKLSSEYEDNYKNGSN